MISPLPRNRCFSLLLTVGLTAWASAAVADTDPGDWLNRMAVAVQSASYEGTVIRIRDGEAEALKVIHTIEDGVIREKVVAQEGRGMEIIRNGNEVHCILPDRKSVLVEEWDNQSTLFSTLPKSKIRFGNEYDLAIVRQERVAGREAMLLAVRPHDQYRYGHRIWLDTKTAFPLQTQLIDENGDAIEQVKFAEIDLDREIQASQIASSYSIDGFTWLRQPGSQARVAISTDWTNDELPAGFKAMSSHKEALKEGGSMTHIVYSDGLADVSVFITASSDEFVAGASRIGNSNAFGAVIDDQVVTAIGEVPPATVQQIASAMRRAP